MPMNRFTPSRRLASAATGGDLALVAAVALVALIGALAGTIAL